MSAISASPRLRRVVCTLRLLLIAGFVCPCFAATRIVTTAIDTTSAWDGAWGVGPFGDNGIETYGQTFIAPSDSRLNQITVFVNDDINSGTVSNPAYLNFKVYVMAWNGSQAAGPMLFQSPKFTTSNNHGLGGMERFDVDTGGIDLTPGGSFVFFLSDSGLFNGNRSTGAVGFLGEFAPDAYAGGQFVSIDNQQNTALWTSASWDHFFPGKDMAFTLSFTPVPEPATVVLALLGGCVLFLGRKHATMRFGKPGAAALRVRQP